MSAKDQIRVELGALCAGVTQLIEFTSGDPITAHAALLPAYQNWYTAALQIVRVLAPDRFDEFRSYYEIDTKRKRLDFSCYVIQDFVFGSAAPEDTISGKPTFDITDTVRLRIRAQAAILSSLQSRISGVLADVQWAIASELEDSTLATAEQLAKVNLRAAGALAGVTIEEHLQRVASARNVSIAKKHPTIADLNDPLKSAGAYDTIAWRKIQHLADIRNLCSHKKDREPTVDEVEQLISGANWISRTIA